jgi:TPR repeat protein/DNA-binding transcriptional regulator GbsR (MarR family)/nucleoside-triphosphatase THEP1
MKMSQTKVAFLYNPDSQSSAELIENFVVRHKEFQEVFSDIKNSSLGNPEQHYIIQGPRGAGKTTLLLRISYEIKNDPDLNKIMVPVMFSEEQYHIRNLCGLWESAAEILEMNEEFAGISESFEAVFGHENYDDICFGILAKALKERRKKLVLFIDNIGDLLGRLNEVEHHRLREILLTSPDICIIGASATTLEATYDYSKPFFDFFKFIYIGGLHSEDISILLRRLGKLYNKEGIENILQNHPERIEVLRRLTGGIPRTIILYFEIFADDASGDSYKDLEVVLDRVTPLYKHRMDDLSYQQQSIMDTLAMNWDAMSTGEIAEKVRMESKAVSAQLKQLEKNGVVHKIETDTKNHLYQITERFFNIWYLMRHGRRKDRNRVLWLVKFMQEWCSKKELIDRAKRHIQALGREDYYAGHAYIMAEALAKTGLPADIEHELLAKTREFLSKKDKALMKELSKSDQELYEDAGTYYTSQDIKGCLRTLDKIKNRIAVVLYAYGLAYFKLGNYKEAEKHYLSASEKGYVGAMNNLATMYAEQKEYSKAEKLYVKAIAKGDTNAMGNLANMYFEQKEYSKAEELYVKAIAKGANAMGNLANVYFEQKEYSKAEELYVKAITKGDAKAMSNLASMYFEQKEYAKAEKWYLKAIENGVVGAMNNLANVYYEQKEHAKAEKWYLKAVENGVVGAMNNLANMYFEQKEHSKAEKWYLEAIENGVVGAMNNLANMYFEQKEHSKAEKWYLEAINKSDVKAMNNLANMYFEQKEYTKAEKLYLKVIESGHTASKTNLANVYRMQKDYSKAKDLYLQAIDEGDKIAPKSLALMYFEQEKYNKAEELFLRLADQGDVDSMLSLALLHLMQKKHKIDALNLTERAYQVRPDVITTLTLVQVLIWNDKIEEALQYLREILSDKDAIENNENQISYCLIFLMAKKQYYLTQKLFEESEHNLKDRLKPIYYALMHYMRDDYPNEFKKMGEELKETVEDIVETVEEFSKDYS